MVRRSMSCTDVIIMDFFKIELKKTVTVSRDPGYSFYLIIRESTEGS
jgi:hypothetical protein